MASRIWFRGDIANAIQAAQLALEHSCSALGGGVDDYLQGYQAGFQAALEGVAAMFGLRPPPKPAQDPRDVRQDGRHP